MSDLDFDKVFGDLFPERKGTNVTVAQLQLEVVSLRQKLAAEQQRNTRLKAKARRLIDVAYNRAIADSTEIIFNECGASLKDAKAVALVTNKILLLRRTVREE